MSGVDLGDLSQDDATAALRSLEEYLQATPVPVTVAGHDFSLDPAAVSFEIDEAALVAQAMEQGREGHLGSQFVWWVRHFFGDEGRTLDLAYDYDEAALMDIVAQWELAGIDNPAFPGEVTVADGLVSFRYPQSGVGIERQQAAALLGAALADPGRAGGGPARPRPHSPADRGRHRRRGRRGRGAPRRRRHPAQHPRLRRPGDPRRGRSAAPCWSTATTPCRPPPSSSRGTRRRCRHALQPEMARLSTVPVNAELLIDIDNRRGHHQAEPQHLGARPGGSDRAQWMPPPGRSAAPPTCPTGRGRSPR